MVLGDDENGHSQFLLSTRLRQAFRRARGPRRRPKSQTRTGSRAREGRCCGTGIIFFYKKDFAFILEAVAIDHESAVLILQVLRLSREPVGVGRLLEGVLPHPGALLRRVREADPVVEVVGEKGEEGGLNEETCFYFKRIIGFLALFITCSLGSSTSTR